MQRSAIINSAVRYAVNEYTFEIITPDECSQYFAIDKLEPSLYSSNIKYYTLENAEKVLRSFCWRGSKAETG